MILKIFIGIVIYFLLLALICLFLKGATKNEREFEEHQEYERIKKELEKEEVDEEQLHREKMNGERELKRP